MGFFGLSGKGEQTKITSPSASERQELPLTSRRTVVRGGALSVRNLGQAPESESSSE